MTLTTEELVHAALSLSAVRGWRDLLKAQPSQWIAETWFTHDPDLKDCTDSLIPSIESWKQSA